MPTTLVNDLGLTAKNAAAEDGAGCCGGGDCACNSGTGSTESTAAIADSTMDAAVTADYLVSGMTCGHCVSSVTEELSDLDGVQRVVVDLNSTGTSTVTVASTAALDVDDVRTAIAEAGYTLVGVAR